EPSTCNDEFAAPADPRGIVIARDGSAGQVRADASSVYWAGLDRISALSKASLSVRSVATSQDPFALTLGPDSVWWVNDSPVGGQVMESSKDGSHIRVIAHDDGQPADIAVVGPPGSPEAAQAVGSDIWVYWTETLRGNVWSARIGADGSVKT